MKKFLPLITCCVVIHVEQTAEPLCSRPAGRGTDTYAPGPNHHKGSLKRPLTAMISNSAIIFFILSHDRTPKARAAGLSAVPTKVSPECRLVTRMNDEQHSIWLATSPVRETERD